MEKKKRKTNLHRQLIAGVIACMFLSGCTSIKERQQKVMGWFSGFYSTASGAVAEVKEEAKELIDTGHSIKDGVKDLLEETNERVQKVQSGVNMLQEGKRLIEEGVGN